VRGTEMLVDLALPYVGMAIIEPECCAAEVSNHSAHERRLAPGSESAAQVGHIQVKQRVDTDPVKVAQLRCPSRAAGHHGVLAVVPALQPVTQLSLQPATDRQAIRRTVPALAAQRSRAGQPGLPVPGAVVAVVVQVAVADIDPAAAVDRAVDRKLAARDRAVAPVEPAVLRSAS